MAECEIYLSCYNWFLQFLYYRRRNKRLRETVVSMLSCGALERSNNPYIESIVKPCVFKNQKGIFAMWKENPEKEMKQWKKLSLNRNLCLCVWERKKKKLSHKKCKSPIQKGFWICRTTYQNILFLYFRDRPKNGEGNKLKKRRKYIRKSN